ncbi:MAG TPA: transporter [Thermoanaerobaculia bacterium]
MKYTIFAAVLLLLVVPTVVAQESEPKDPESEASELLTGVQDNSFLLEEAYNQEPGIVQHISVLTYDHDAEAWGYAFTQEWPLFSMKHQFSYTIPIDYDDEANLGDIALNYRYQLVGKGESRVAVSPRLSVILPTSDDAESTGVQVGLPISTILGERVPAHTNFGATWFDDDKDAEYLVGQSLIYTITPRVNALVEALWTGNSDEHSMIVSPGIRWAYNLSNGSQVVPGIAYAMNVSDDDDGGDAVLFYFSYENAFGRH